MAERPVPQDCLPHVHNLKVEKVNSKEIPDKNALLGLIRSCMKSKNLPKLRRIHNDILRSKILSKDMYLITSLLTVYAKCGAIGEAHRLFDELPRRDIISWNAIITSYSQNGFPNEVMYSFERMRTEGFTPNAITFCLVFKACGSLGYVEVGEQLHAEATREGLLEHNVVLGTALVDMYGRFGLLVKAREVFDGLLARNVVSWNALITGYVKHGLGNIALKCFHEMQEKGIIPNEVTFICALKACGSTGCLKMGEEIHAEVRRLGLLAERSNHMLGNTLVDMYAKCGMMGKARNVFEELRVRDVVSWNALVTGYAHHGLGDEALKCFRQMRDEGIDPNEVTFIAILKACGSIGCLDIGEWIHSEIGRRPGLLAKEVALSNTLVDMYAKCGVMEKALEVFDDIPVPDVVSWNALIVGYAQNGLGEEALSFFCRMRDEHITPDAFTFSCVLKACADVGALEMGQEIHVEVSKQGLVERDIVLGTTLVDMYAKCGLFKKAQEVFKALPGEDIVSWNAIMAAYVQVGQARKIFRLFRQMMAEGVDATSDIVAFLLLLTVCSHAGLTKEGQMVFERMKTVYCLSPTLDHYTCMVDLLGRAGQFYNAVCILEHAPSSCDRIPLLLALMGACYKWVNVELGKWAFKQSVELDEKCEAAYVCMGNIYAVAGMHSEAEKLDALRMRNDIACKIPIHLLVD